jgi:ribosomal protein L2
MKTKKQKDKKINNGRHNNTQTDNIMAKKQKDKKINNGRHNNTQSNRQYNDQETQTHAINDYSNIVVRVEDIVHNPIGSASLHVD